MKTQISIIGCGWLGFPLAKYLLKKGYLVNGSTTTNSKLEILKNNGISPFLIELNETSISESITPFLNGSDTVIINIPPGLRKQPKKNHVKEIELIVSHLEMQNIKHVLYISSTSVYQDKSNFPVITENKLPNAISNNGKQLVSIEKMLQNNKNFKTTILRFSGLFDENRHPGKVLSERKNISNPEAPVNLIHKTDCISIISKLIEKNIWDQEFNACNPHHPIKKEYYTNYCVANNLPQPKFNTKNRNEGKYIDSSKLVQLLNYSFKTGL